MERIDHIGIAVRSAEEAAARYALLGLVRQGSETVRTEGVRIAFLKVGGTRIELLEPTDDTGPVAKFLRDRGEGVHHVAFAVRDIEAAMSRAREQGFRVIDETPRTGHGGRKVVFIHPRSAHGVLLEFVQE